LVTLRKAKNPTKPELEAAVPDWIEEANKYEYDADFLFETPSQLPFPVFALCPPLYVDTKISNNVWMKELNGEAKEIDKERFMGEWYNFYKLLSSDSMVLLIPSRKGLQDQVYVNSFVYLPHIDRRDTIILSNFTAEGRAGEEMVAGDFLKKWNYDIYKCPFRFEGYPELKYLKDNIYFGGYGFRTEIGALNWIEKSFDCEIIKIKETDPHLYHLDCTLFVLTEENVMCCVEAFDKATVKQIEKVCNIHPVSKDACHESVCNSVRVGDMILTSSSLMFMQKRDPKYKKEWKKNEEVEKICSDLGLEILYLEMSEAGKSGAALSCFCTPLNVRF
jgi:N-dimethylarginine dimethylaminohydrolase